MKTEEGRTNWPQDLSQQNYVNQHSNMHIN